MAPKAKAKATKKTTMGASHKKRATPARAAAKTPKKPAPPANAAPPEPIAFTIALGTNERVAWFSETKSENEQLRGLKCTEAELIRKAARASGIGPEQILRTGMQAYAKRLLANAANSDPAGSKGIAGANDPAFRDAYTALKKEGDGKAITPSRIAYRAAELTKNPALARAYRSAQRWLRIHHPEELARVTDANASGKPQQ